LSWTGLNWIEVLGALAGVLTTIAFVPQVARTWRTQSARDLSLPMLLLLVTGVVLWLGYGLLIGSAGLIAANAVTFLLSASLLLVKLRRG
jgi:MtN3 and saliva related transmembrane protein